MSRRGVSKEASSSANDMQQEFKAAFGLFTEGKEKLDADQLNRTLKKFGVKGDARAMIKEADTANEGSIDFIAFSAMMAKKMASVRSPCKHRNFGRRPTQDDIRDAFEKFDWRKSGDVPTKELVDALSNLGKPLSTREEFLKVCERDGQVRYNEFITQMFGAKAQN